MSNAIIYMTFIPWLLYFIMYGRKGIFDTDQIKKDGVLKWIKKYFFQVFRLDTLILILVFIHFLKYDNVLIDKMLFAAINLYLFVSSLYDKPSKKKILKKHWIMVATIVIVLSIPVVYYYNTSNLEETYTLMFAYTFFAYFIVMISSGIELILKKIFKR